MKFDTRDMVVVDDVFSAIIVLAIVQFLRYLDFTVAVFHTTAFDFCMSLLVRLFITVFCGILLTLILYVSLDRVIFSCFGQMLGKIKKIY
jgi:hypothetical protein